MYYVQGVLGKQAGKSASKSHNQWTVTVEGAFALAPPSDFSPGIVGGPGRAQTLLVLAVSPHPQSTCCLRGHSCSPVCGGGNVPAGKGSRWELVAAPILHVASSGGTWELSLLACPPSLSCTQCALLILGLAPKCSSLLPFSGEPKLGYRRT